MRSGRRTRTARSRAAAIGCTPCSARSACSGAADVILLLFDEMEDLFAEAVNAVGGGRRAGSKIFINRLIEGNKVPTIWTSNAIWDVDPAHLRRFSYVLHMDHPSPRARARIVARAAEAAGASEAAAGLDRAGRPRRPGGERRERGPAQRRPGGRRSGGRGSGRPVASARPSRRAGASAGSRGRRARPLALRERSARSRLCSIGSRRPARRAISRFC